MQGLNIAKINKEVLNKIIEIGKYEAEVQIGKYKIYFDLASAGDESEMEVWVLQKNGGIYNDMQKRIAILARNITKIATVDFAEQQTEEDKVTEKYVWLKKLQLPVLNFLWESYVAFRIQQEAEFAELLQNAKKSLPTQNTVTFGSSSTNAEQ